MLSSLLQVWACNESDMRHQHGAEVYRDEGSPGFCAADASIWPCWATGSPGWRLPSTLVSCRASKLPAGCSVSCAALACRCSLDSAVQQQDRMSADCSGITAEGLLGRSKVSCHATPCRPVTQLQQHLHAILVFILVSDACRIGQYTPQKG